MSKKTIAEIKEIITNIQSDIRAAQTCLANAGFEDFNPSDKNKIMAAFNYNEKALRGLNKLSESQG